MSDDDGGGDDGGDGGGVEGKRRLSLAKTDA